MTFRFGNNGTVACSKAIFVPISKVWMKIAIVQSQTPFLISNSVFRNLDAIVDTGKQQIEFRKLGCTVPVRLSERKLFLLDIKELIEKAEDPHAESLGSVRQETIFQSQGEDKHEIEHEHDIKENIIGDKNKVTTNQTCPLQNDRTTSSSTSRPENPLLSENPSVKESLSFVNHDLGRFSAGQSLREDASSHNGGGRHEQAEGNALQRTAGAHDQVWRRQTWTTIPPSCPRRSSLLQVVPFELRQLPVKGTHQEFAFYLRAYTEKMENMEKITGGKKDHKSKAPGKGASSKENPKTPSLSEEEDWGPIEGGVPRDLETHFRINQLEQMMQQMMIQVQGLTQAVQQGMKPSEQ